jgi:peptide/nickel transport system substrate-binding protein
MRAEILVALSLVLVLASACTEVPAPASFITLAVPSSPNNLDPRVGTDEMSQRAHQLIFNTLLTLDERLQVGPGLADGWSTPDDRTYVVRLGPGVRFHDGHELTSADVVHTFTSLLDPAFVSPRKGAYRMLTAVEAMDRYTVRFVLKEPFGSFPVNLVLPIVPAGSGAALRDHPIGTGPYEFVSHAPDDRVVVKAFPRYHDGPPKNAGIVLKVVPDDIMRGLELRKGTVDLIVNDLAPDIVHQLSGDDHLRVEEAPGTDYAYIGMNLKDSILQDRRVRHAIAHAIDRESIVKHLRRGLAEPATGILPPASHAFEPNVPTFAYDPARARELLDEAGYRDPDGEGPRPRFRLSLKVSSVEFNRLQSAVIQQNLARVGIELDVRTYEFATLYADVLRGSFQLFTLQWVGVSDPDMLRRVFHSSQMPPVGFNRGFYSNREVDLLIDRATISTDPAERQQLYAEVQRLVAGDAPYVSLWYKTNVAVVQAGLTGVRLTPSADFSFLRHVSRADLRTAR